MPQHHNEYTSATPPLGPHPRGLLEILWQRRFLLAVGAAVGVALGAAYHLTAVPAYSSTAQVLVLKKRPDTGQAADANASASDEFLSSQPAVLKSPVLIARAVEKGSLCPLPTFVGEKDELTEAIGKRLTVTRNREAGGGSNNVFSLSFKAAQPEDSVAVLRSLLEAYVETLEQSYRKGTDETLGLIAKARNVLQEDLAKKQAAHRAFRRDAPLLWKGKEWINARQERLAGIETKRTALLVRDAELQGQLAALETAMKDGRDRTALLDLVATLSGKQDTTQAPTSRAAALPDALHPLLMQERKLLESFGEDHPDVVALRKRIETTRALFTRPAAAWDRKLHEGDPVEGYLRFLRQELVQVKESERLLSELFEKEHAEAKKLSAYEDEDEHHRNDIARSQQLFEDFIKRLEDARLAGDVGGYEARIIAPPGTPRKVEPNIMLSLSLTGLLSLLGAAALVGLAELMTARPPAPERNGFYDPAHGPAAEATASRLPAPTRPPEPTRPPRAHSNE